jgi:hypothetical protein
LFKPEMQNVILLGMMGLHSGIACTGTGTCGSIIGSAFAIAYVVGVTPEDIARNPRLNVTPCIPIVEDIMDRFEETYGATDCMRLRYNRTQRAFDFLDPDAAMYEALFAFSESKKCGFFANCYECGTDQGMPSEPEERKKIPLHLQGYGMMELKPKIEKVAQLMKELGLGRPNEKISWREYRRLKLKGKKGVEENRPCGADAPDNKY